MNQSTDVLQWRKDLGNDDAKVESSSQGLNKSISGDFRGKNKIKALDKSSVINKLLRPF